MAIQTVILNEGDSYFVPKGAKILSITDPDSLGLSSPSGCINTTPPLTKCYMYGWEGLGNGTDYSDAFFTGIKINNTTYSFNSSLGPALTYDNGSALITEIPRVAPFITVEATFGLGGGAETDKSITIKVPDTVEPPILLWQSLTGSTFTQYSAMLPSLVDCPTPIV